MLPEDKAKTTIPTSPAQEALERVDRRDRLVRAIELFVFTCLVVFNVLIGVGILKVIDQNQKDALVRSEQASLDRKEQKDYIKCVLLIRFDTPPEDLTTRKGVEKALDACAATRTNE